MKRETNRFKKWMKLGKRKVFMGSRNRQKQNSKNSWMPPKSSQIKPKPTQRNVHTVQLKEPVIITRLSMMANLLCMCAGESVMSQSANDLATSKMMNTQASGKFNVIEHSQICKMIVFVQTHTVEAHIDTVLRHFENIGTCGTSKQNIEIWGSQHAHWHEHGVNNPSRPQYSEHVANLIQFYVCDYFKNDFLCLRYLSPWSTRHP